MEDLKLVEELINKAKKYNLFEGNKYFEAIEHILLDYKRVLKENKSLQKTYDDCYCKYKHYKQFESISVQKVKDKIEELKNKEYNEYLTNYYGTKKPQRMKEFQYKIEVLQELLEENENHIPIID